MLTRKLIYANGQWQGGSLAGDEIMQIDISIAVNIRRPGDLLAVRRKIACTDLPLVLGEPRNLLARNVQQSNIVVAIRSVRSNQQLFAIRGEIIDPINLFTLMRSQQGTLTRHDFRQ